MGGGGSAANTAGAKLPARRAASSVGRPRWEVYTIGRRVAPSNESQNNNNINRCVLKNKKYVGTYIVHCTRLTLCLCVCVSLESRSRPRSVGGLENVTKYYNMLPVGGHHCIIIYTIKVF